MRLWLASTDEPPKQFHALGTSATMIQDTAARVQSSGFLPPMVIGNHRHGAEAAEQFIVIGVVPPEVMLEPFGRNTASVAMVGAACAERHTPGALVLLMPANHVIADIDGFRGAVMQAGRAALDRSVTFAIQLGGPETGYGYIPSGDRIYDGVIAIRRFAEKLQRDVPKHISQKAATIGWAPDPEHFATTPSEPIDIAVMEKTDKAAVMPISVGLADIGSWSEPWRHAADHDEASHTQGETMILDTTEYPLWTNAPRISVTGLSDIVVVALRDHVLVTPKDRAQDVKKIVEQWGGRS